MTAHFFKNRIAFGLITRIVPEREASLQTVPNSKVICPLCDYLPNDIKRIILSR